MTTAVGLDLEGGIAGTYQLHVLGELGVLFGRQRLCQRRIVDALVLDRLADALAIGSVEDQHAVVGEIVGALEILAGAGRPAHRRHVEREGRGDLVEQLDRVLALAIHLVDEGHDRHVAQAADLEQLARARLDTLGGVDHHDGRVDRRQGAVGVLAEVLVARRVKQVEDRAAIFEMHHRGRDRDAALLLDLHPVRARAAGFATRLDRTRDVDGAAEQQQLLGQRGLAGVRMGDDRERAPEASRMAGQAGVEIVRNSGIGHF